MAQKVDPSVFVPEDLADESLFDEEEPLTRPGIAAPRVVPPRSGSAPKAASSRASQVRIARDPDAEAVAIVNKVIEKVAVAKSLARIASSLARSYADQKMAQIVETDAGNAIAHVERARRVATAVKEAATHAASLATARAAARTQDAMSVAQAMLDPEDRKEEEG